MNWLILRGLFRERRHWGDFPERLGAAFPGGRVVALDLPGTGVERDRPCPLRIDGIVDDVRGRFQRSDGPWGLLAVSLGGMVAMDWASRHPDEFAAIVLSNTSARDVGGPFERFAPRHLPRVVRIALGGDPIAREQHVLAITSNAPPDRRAATARDWASLGSVPARTGAAQLVAASRYRLPERLGVPALVLVGEGDRLVSPACSRRLAERIGAPIDAHPTAGHDLPHDDPDWVIERMVAFAARLPRAAIAG